jgi:hypothetical protein
MLRTNLSTRPFYNERGVHALAGVIAIAVLAVTIWQVARIVALSRYKTELNMSIRRERTEAEAASREAQQIRRGLDQKELATLSAEAREARDLIAQRTFSWTGLFNELEATLPGEVMLVGVHPEISGGVTQVHLDVQGKSEEDITNFWDRLEKTGRFRDVSWSNTTITPEGYSQMAMTALYTPNRAAAQPAAVPPLPQPPASGEPR